MDNAEISRLMSKASGISSDLDETLVSLSANMIGAEAERLQRSVSALYRQIAELKKNYEDIIINLMDRDFDSLKSDKLISSIVNQFDNNPSVVSFYDSNLTEKLVRSFPSPKARVALCKELVKQTQKYHPNYRIPKFWLECIEKRGLVEIELESDTNSNSDAEQADLY